MYNKKIFYQILLALLCSFLLSACGIRTLIQITEHQKEIGRTLPDTFRMELPLIQHNFHFYVQGKVNNQHNVMFAIDNMASNILRAEDVDEMSGSFWNRVPIRTRNAYGQRERAQLYLLDSLQIGDLTFRQPHFTRMTGSNAIHELLSDIALEKDGARVGVLGNNILPLMYWKFDLDNEKMILFSNRDSTLITEETAGFTRIENALRNIRPSLQLDFPTIQESHRFFLDVGFSGEIGINRRSFRNLSNQLPYRRVMVARTAELSETIYLFDNVDLKIGGILVKNSQITHTPLSNFNIIGNRFMQRFNFILAYGVCPREMGKRHGHAYRDLYIKPVAGFDNIQSTPFVTAMGFRFGTIGNELQVTAIEVGSVAEASGLQLRDKIISVGAYDLENHTREKLVAYIADRESVVVKVKRGGSIVEIPISKGAN